MKIFGLYLIHTVIHCSELLMYTRKKNPITHTHTHTHTHCIHVHMYNCMCVHRLLVAKMKYVFEQVMLVDGTRKMKSSTVQKTFKAAEFLIKFIMKSRAIYDE